ncbi:hypothetical protein [Corynebacterium parakroppenstedtii]|uniref:hypothetical protein n=1 Tax=Corynebacterium parakroppenstedtii TaxID=2828363 RepID=UPI001F2E6B75|nr:hypothetical protein [Corynebacterium parakroppenstedtii]MCF7183835.1 hypothetical protein [Corynebacterium parakroppenstedtii]
MQQHRLWLHVRQLDSELTGTPGHPTDSSRALLYLLWCARAPTPQHKARVRRGAVKLFDGVSVGIHTTIDDGTAAEFGLRRASFSRGRGP